MCILGGFYLDAVIIRHLGSLDTVSSGVGSLASVSQKSRRDIRQKNRRPVTVIGGQKLRSKPDDVVSDGKFVDNLISDKRNGCVVLMMLVTQVAVV